MAMSPTTVTRPVTRLAALLAAGLIPTLLVAAPTLAQAGSVQVTTPYPTIETQAGATVRFDLDVQGPTMEAVELDVGDVPTDWQTTLRGGGFVIHSITAGPDTPAKAELEVTLPPDLTSGAYPIDVTAHDSAGRTDTAHLVLDVVDIVRSGVKVTADFPSLSGDPGSTFTYNLTITNDTPEDQTFTFDPNGPQGWSVDVSPTAQANASTVTIAAGSNEGIKVEAVSPEGAKEGTYPVTVNAVAANGATGSIELAADVIGTPELVLSTADQRLDVTGRSNSELRIPLIVANTGTGPIDAVNLAASAPSGWDVSFEPGTTGRIDGGDTTQVTAIVKPSADAVAGDYAMTIRSSAGSQSSNIDIRYSLQGSRLLGLVAVAVIAAAFAGLAGVFVKFGRR
jgi:uncharacterized membrane protein